MGRYTRGMSEYQYMPRNRETAQRAKRGLFWCGCDRARVGEFGKCPECGRVGSPKKFRTPFVDRPKGATPAAILLQREIEETDDMWAEIEERRVFAHLKMLCGKS